MIDFESGSKLFCYSNFQTRRMNVLQRMDSIFGPVPISPVNIETSIINENWPCFYTISDVIFTVNSPPSRVT